LFLRPLRLADFLKARIPQFYGSPIARGPGSLLCTFAIGTVRRLLAKRGRRLRAKTLGRAHGPSSWAAPGVELHAMQYQPGRRSVRPRKTHPDRKIVIPFREAGGKLWPILFLPLFAARFAKPILNRARVAPDPFESQH